MRKGGSNKKTRCVLSSESNLIESPMVVPLVVGNDNANIVTPRISSEELAKNRGNAMLRYKEKKKTRRYSSLNITLHVKYTHTHTHYYVTCKFLEREKASCIHETLLLSLYSEEEVGFTN